MKLLKQKEGSSFSEVFSSSTCIRLSLLISVAIILVISLHPNPIKTKHVYKIGDIAVKNVKASKDFFVEDQNATKIKLATAIGEVLSVYDNDVQVALNLSLKIKRAFEFLSKQTNASKNFENAIGIEVSDDALKILKNQELLDNVSISIITILTKILENGVVENKHVLLQESDKGIILRTSGDTQSEKNVYNLKQFYGFDQAKTMVRIIGQPFLTETDYNLRNLIVDFAQRLIIPNITLNVEETNKRKRAAEKKVKPVFYDVKTGEMLLREGEKVGQIQFLKLNVFNQIQTKKQLLERGVGAFAIGLFLFIIMYMMAHTKNDKKFENSQEKSLIFIATVFITFFFIARISASIFETLAYHSPLSISDSSMIFGIPVAAGAMIICLFIGIDIAVFAAAALAVCVALIFHNKFDFFIYFFLSGLMAAYWAQNCKERKILIKAGVKLGLLNAALATAIGVYASDLSTPDLLWNLAFAFAGGVSAGIITIGVAPIVEIAFDYTTDIKLLELANLDQPILRKLMIEAPGTYHHCVLVGSMVEAAASEIGANSLLAKVCGYYHDIGKIKKPSYFIENQQNGKNKHTKLAPSMSSLILIAHIKNGVEIAKKNKLGSAITDAIQQHHGTSLIRFFYEKAKKLKKETVNIDDFRYPGPKPQTREAGLVMLADVVEATSRTLDNPTPSRIQGLVQNLINKIFSDGQLDNCELTLRDLHKIAKIYNKILNGIHHHRIKYTDDLSVNSEKKKNDSSDKQQTKQTQNSSGSNTEDGANRLKRLGQR